jgi:RNA polymerase sigma factor (sigma-70 family)
MTIQRKLVSDTTQSPLLQDSEDVASGADLLLRIGNGDATAWDGIFHRYGELVSTTVRSFRLQEADALDAVQMTWLQLTENAHRVQFPERLAGWLATTARRECLRILRQAKPSLDVVDMTPETVADPSVSPEQQAIDTDTAQTLRKLVAELSPRRQTLVRMLFTDYPLSYAVARAAGIPPGGIGPTRARALRQLREKLHEHELESGTPPREIRPTRARALRQLRRSLHESGLDPEPMPVRDHTRSGGEAWPPDGQPPATTSEDLISELDRGSQLVVLHNQNVQIKEETWSPEVQWLATILALRDSETRSNAKR